MKMHFLSGGRVRMRRATFIPDADRSEMIELPVSCALLRHAPGNVLFDTGCHPSVIDDPAERCGGLAKIMTPVCRGRNVLTGLSAIGFRATSTCGSARICTRIIAAATRSSSARPIVRSRRRSKRREAEVRGAMGYGIEWTSARSTR